MEKPEDTYTNHMKNAEYYGVPTPPYPYPGAVKKVVTADVLNVRGGPGTSYPVVGTLYKDAIVTVLGSLNGYAKIGESRWCSESYLRRI